MFRPALSRPRRRPVSSAAASASNNAAQPAARSEHLASAQVEKPTRDSPISVAGDRDVQRCSSGKARGAKVASSAEPASSPRTVSCGYLAACRAAVKNATSSRRKADMLSHPVAEVDQVVGGCHRSCFNMQERTVHGVSRREQCPHKHNSF